MNKIHLSALFATLLLSSGVNGEVFSRCEYQVLKKIGIDIPDETANLNELLYQSHAVKLKFLRNRSVALRAATQRLSSNRLFTFSSNAHLLQASENFWEESKDSFGRIQLLSKGKAEDAIRSFYFEFAQSDCLAGTRIANYATELEYTENDQFNWKYNRISIDLFPVFLNSWQEITSELRSSLGAMSFIGIPGVVANVYGEEYLDSPTDRGENFLIVDMSSEAARLFGNPRSEDDLKAINDKLRKIWKLGKKFSTDKLTNLMQPNQATLQSASLRTLRLLLEDPILSGTTIWVHPLKPMTFAEHIVRLIQLNPRTPYSIRLFDYHSIGAFDEYVKNEMDFCKHHQISTNP